MIYKYLFSLVVACLLLGCETQVNIEDKRIDPIKADQAIRTLAKGQIAIGETVEKMEKRILELEKKRIRR